MVNENDVTPESKKILLLNGSPHREGSTTLFAAEQFAHGIADTLGAEIETIHIADLDIRPCTGCLSCWGRTEGECVIRNDDVQMVKEKILAADIIIESFPLYFFGMPGIVKMLTDRMLCMGRTYEGQSLPKDGSSAHGLRYYNPDQSFVLISACAYAEADRLFDPLKEQYDLICGEGTYTHLFFPQLKTLVDIGGGRKSRFAKRAYDAGKEYALSGTLSEETVRKLVNPPFAKDIYKTIIKNVFDAERSAT